MLIKTLSYFIKKVGRETSHTLSQAPEDSVPLVGGYVPRPVRRCKYVLNENGEIVKAEIEGDSNEKGTDSTIETTIIE